MEHDEAIDSSLRSIDTYLKDLLAVDSQNWFDLGRTAGLSGSDLAPITQHVEHEYGRSEQRADIRRTAHLRYLGALNAGVSGGIPNPLETEIKAIEADLSPDDPLSLRSSNQKIIEECDRRLLLLARQINCETDEQEETGRHAQSEAEYSIFLSSLDSDERKRFLAIIEHFGNKIEKLIVVRQNIMVQVTLLEEAVAQPGANLAEINAKLATLSAFDTELAKIQASLSQDHLLMDEIHRIASSARDMAKPSNRASSVLREKLHSWRRASKQYRQFLRAAFWIVIFGEQMIMSQYTFKAFHLTPLKDIIEKIGKLSIPELVANVPGLLFALTFGCFPLVLSYLAKLYLDHNEHDEEKLRQYKLVSFGSVLFYLLALSATTIFQGMGSWTRACEAAMLFGVSSVLALIGGWIMHHRFRLEADIALKIHSASESDALLQKRTSAMDAIRNRLNDLQRKQHELADRAVTDKRREAISVGMQVTPDELKRLFEQSKGAAVAAATSGYNVGTAIRLTGTDVERPPMNEEPAVLIDRLKQAALRKALYNGNGQKN